MGLSGKCQRSGRFNPGGRTSVPILQEIGWATEPLWMVMKEEKLLALTEVRTPTVQPVASRYPDYAVPVPLTIVHIKHRIVKLLIM